MSDCSSREEERERGIPFAGTRSARARTRGLMAVPADPSVLVLASRPRLILVSSSISHERDWDFLISSRRQLARRLRI